MWTILVMQAISAWIIHYLFDLICNITNCFSLLWCLCWCYCFTTIIPAVHYWYYNYCYWFKFCFVWWYVFFNFICINDLFLHIFVVMLEILNILFNICDSRIISESLLVSIVSCLILFDMNDIVKFILSINHYCDWC